jgi:hypothetical protein
MNVEDIIKSSVDKFLAWKLPAGVPTRMGMTLGEAIDAKANPIGTHLLTADQAREMFTHCLKEALQKHAVEIRNNTLDEAAQEMAPMLRDMISRGHARS